MQNLITNHLDIWTSAHKTRSTAGRGSSNKLDLVGIKKLRELILELAVRGKLVPQDPSDEPASELLKKIAAEKAKLIKEGKIKKEKPLPEITDEEKPFELPRGWEFVRLSQVTSVRGGSTPSMAKSEFWGGDILWVSPKDMHDGAIYSSELKITEKALKETSLELVPVGSILIVGRSGILKRKLPAQITGVPCTVNQDIKAVTPIAPLSDRYLQLMFWGNEREILVRDVKQGTTVQSLVYESLFTRPFCLPPLPEQHRIVAKVDELMAFCDQLEQTQSDNIAAHAHLVEALLATLTNSSDHNELQNNWQRIAAHFDTLFTTENSIDQLKQTILQLAVMGKLVPQNPNDEPASELLKKIAAEKEQLIKEGKIKKEKPLPEITYEDINFSSPHGWAWSRMGDLALFQKGYAFKSEEYLDSGLMITKIQNLTENHIENSVYIAQDRASEFSQYLLFEGDIVMTTVGSWFSAPLSAVGRSFLINKLFDNSLLNQNAVRIRFWGKLDPMYLLIYLKSSMFKSYLVQEAQGTANQASITQESIKGFLLCIPPREEQHRIVAKVDELMVLCGTLKTNLQNAETTQLALADALIEQAVG